MANRIDQLEQGQKIIIMDKLYNLDVSAPLPENYGFGIGADISSPFASYATEGVASKVLALSAGASQKIGITTKKLFMGPEQPDLSVDLKFDAYYSALEEVVLPTIKLGLMASGEQKGLKEDLKVLADKAFESFDAAGAVVAAVVDVIDVIEQKALESDLISYLKSPSTVYVKFGDVFELTNAFISNINITYSNVLDSNFLPMEATVNLTLTPQDPFTKSTIGGMFFNKL